MPDTCFGHTRGHSQGGALQRMYVVGSKSFRPDQLFKVTEIKQICYFST